MSQIGLDAVGLDTSGAMLQQARRLGGPEYVRGDASSLPFVGETKIVFEALQESFRAGDAVGDLVMVASISNCCPLPSSPGATPIPPGGTSD